MCVAPYASAAILENPTRNPLRTGAPNNTSQTAQPSTTTASTADPKQWQNQIDRILEPLVNRPISGADLKAVKAAIQATYGKNFAKAISEQRRIRDRNARKLVTWYLLRAKDGPSSAADAKRFFTSNPDWPSARTKRRAEKKLLLQGSAANIQNYFTNLAPSSGIGMAALAKAHRTAGRTGKARQLIATAWRDHDLDRETEAAIVAGFSNLLSESDHLARINRLLYRDSRWRGVRNRRAASIKRAMKFLSPPERTKTKARLAVYQRSKSAAGLYAKLPKSALKDWGVYFQKIQHLRRSKKLSAAWSLLLKAPTDRDSLFNPDEWWIERRVNAYKAIYAGKPRIAYRLIATNGPVSVNEKIEGTFLAGWIAFRLLSDAKTGEKHFRAMQAAADGPRSRSKSAYWLARTLKAQGRPAEADAHFRRSARNFNTFYGILARQTLQPNGGLLRIALPTLPSTGENNDFAARDAIDAAIIAQRAGVSSVMRPLIAHLRYRLKAPGELLLLAALANRLGDTQMAVRTGKTGLARGQNLVHFAYPTHAMPKFKPLRSLPEPAILYAVARQESEFNTLIQSGAGARGILQVMPATARQICRQYRIKCKTSDLKSNPAHNARLASAYIADRKDDFTGSYIMTLAGYNAGPGRVRYWVKQNGDPRHRSVDPIDWIERIHIKETREYVKKVLANLQVYRARLGEEKTAVRLIQDLNRGSN